MSRSIENKKLDRNGKNEEQIMNAKRVQMGSKSNKEGTLYSKHTVLRRFQVPLEAHETKEKETKEQVSDAN